MKKTILYYTAGFILLTSVCHRALPSDKHLQQPLDKQKEDQKYPFTLPPLAYAYDELKPYIDAKTMDIHYNKHHKSYVKGLNDALIKYPKLQKKSLTELLTHLDEIPTSIRNIVRKNGGGHYAHSLYWNILTPKGGEKPNGKLAKAISANFGGFKTFKNMFEQVTNTFFGSGWVWLCTSPDGKLRIIATPNHDVPMSQGYWPILVIDMWEHAYYLKYQNRRDEYVDAWWNIVNWPQVEQYYLENTKEKNDD